MQDLYSTSVSKYDTRLRTDIDINIKKKNLRIKRSGSNKDKNVEKREVERVDASHCITEIVKKISFVKYGNHGKFLEITNTSGA